MKPTDDVGLSSGNAQPDNEPSTSPTAGTSGSHPGCFPKVAFSPDTYAEWDDESTIAAIEDALTPMGDVVRLEANHAFPDLLRESQPDIVFNVAEGWGGPSRESFIPTFCEFWDIPYTGSDPITLGICLDKSRTKEVLAFHGIPTPPHIVVDRLPRIRPRALELPVIVKPLHEGSSKGVTEASLCDSWKRAEAEIERISRDYQQPALVERYLPGREFTVAIIGNGAGARALPLVELDFGSLPAGARAIYGFEAKWIWDRPEAPLAVFQCPARCAVSLANKIESVALAAYRALRCRDWARIDVRCDGNGEPHVIEVNPLPGIIPDPAANSCFPKAARAAGFSYDELVRYVLRSACDRYELRVSA